MESKKKQVQQKYHLTVERSCINSGQNMQLCLLLAFEFDEFDFDEFVLRYCMIIVLLWDGF